MKLTSAIFSTLLISFTAASSMAGEFSCDKAAADKALSEILAIDNYKGDLALYKMANLNTIRAYILLLESNSAKTSEEKINLMQQAMDICNSEAP